MIYLTCAAGGALAVSGFWWWRLSAARRQAQGAARLLRHATRQIGVLCSQIRALGHEPNAAPPARKSPAKGKSP